MSRARRIAVGLAAGFGIAQGTGVRALGGAVFAAAGLVIAVQRLAPPPASTGLSADAVRVIVEQAVRNLPPR